MVSSEEKGQEEADSAARAAGVEPSELHIEACAICCDDIILGPHSAVLKMKIPEARAAASEGRGRTQGLRTARGTRLVGPPVTRRSRRRRS